MNKNQEQKKKEKGQQKHTYLSSSRKYKICHQVSSSYNKNNNEYNYFMHIENVYLPNIKYYNIFVLELIDKQYYNNKIEVSTMNDDEFHISIAVENKKPIWQYEIPNHHTSCDI